MGESVFDRRNKTDFGDTGLFGFENLTQPSFRVARFNRQRRQNGLVVGNQSIVIAVQDDL